MTRLIFISGVMFCAAIATADDVLPKRAEFARYQSMLNRSPFAVATAPIASAGPPDFAKDLYVANAAHSPDGDLVTIASTSDKNFKEYLSTKAPVDGYSLTNVEWSDRVGQTTVTITKDGKYATLTFNQALLSQPLQNPVQPQVNAIPNVPPAVGRPPASYIKPAPIPSLPPSMQNVPQPVQPTQNRIYSRGVIQRNPAAATPVPTPVPSDNGD